MDQEGLQHRTGRGREGDEIGVVTEVGVADEGAGAVAPLQRQHADQVAVGGAHRVQGQRGGVAEDTPPGRLKLRGEKDAARRLHLLDQRPPGAAEALPTLGANVQRHRRSPRSKAKNSARVTC